MATRFGPILTVFLMASVMACSPSVGGTPALPAPQSSPIAAANSSGEAAVIEVARLITPTVVGISAGTGAGSGVIIREDGVILTNAHVVGNAQQVRVGLADGRQLTGRVLGRDVSIDIAVVQVPARQLPVAPLGDSDLLEPGQAAIAIGNPAGFERTVTTGVISGVNRALGARLEELIQTDAAINPGNSGGPLLDSSGRVVGINTAVLRGAGNFVGLGFAVPINLARDIAEQLLTTGIIRRAFLGVSYQEITPEIALRFNIPVQQGLMLMAVGPGSPAGEAGLQQGDVITRVDQTAITRGGDLRRILRERDAGDVIRISGTRRNGQTFSVDVRLTEVEISE
jgi:S1-C subfamily serine protease